MSSRVKFSLEGLKEEPQKQRKRHSKRRYVYIDLGTPTPFSIKLDRGMECHEMHRSGGSFLGRLTINSVTAEVLVVRWGGVSDSVSDKEEVACAIASDCVAVPQYKGKKVYVFEGRHVSVALRSYIEGSTLRSLLVDMHEDVVDHVSSQVAGVMRLLAGKSSSSFGRVTRGEFKTSTAPEYLVQTIIRSSLANDNDKRGTLVAQEPRDEQIPAVFCHGNITPDHVIVRGATVVGIVGWSKADYIPEALEKANHERLCGNDKAGLFHARLAHSNYVAGSSKPSSAFARAIQESCGIDLSVFNLNLPRDSDVPFPLAYQQASTVPRRASRYAETRSDEESLESLTNATLQTWERQTTTTTA